MKKLKISKENQKDINLWRALMAQPGWKRLTEELQRKIDEADMIVNAIGADREAEFSKRDIAIIKKNAYKDLIEIPQRNITALSGTGERDIEEFDPFDNGFDDDFADDDVI